MRWLHHATSITNYLTDLNLLKSTGKSIESLKLVMLTKSWHTKLEMGITKPYFKLFVISQASVDVCIFQRQHLDDDNLVKH